MINPTRFIWLNGGLVNWKKANVHILTHGLHYGSGVFEGIRCYDTEHGPAIFRLDDHFNRFSQSAAAAGMKLPFSQSQLRQATLQLITANKLGDCYLRPIAFYGYGAIAPDPRGAAVGVAIIALNRAPSPAIGRGLKSKISKFIRLHPDSVIVSAKVCGYYANSLLALKEARAAGCEEAIFLDYRGYVAEATGRNIFIVRNGKLMTPRPYSILSGITRETVFGVAHDLGWRVAERDLTTEELLVADEVFLTGTATEISWVRAIGRKIIGHGRIGPITRQLQTRYADIVRGRIKKYRRWLTYIPDIC